MDTMTIDYIWATQVLRGNVDARKQEIIVRDVVDHFKNQRFAARAKYVGQYDSAMFQVERYLRSRGLLRFCL